MERERIRPAAFVCPARPCGRLLEPALGQKSPRARRPAAPGADIPAYAGHRDRLRPPRAIGSAHDQSERFRAKPLHGERDACRRGVASLLSREWGSMSTVASSVPSASSAVDRVDGTFSEGTGVKVEETELTMLTVQTQRRVLWGEHSAKSTIHRTARTGGAELNVAEVRACAGVVAGTDSALPPTLAPNGGAKSSKRSLVRNKR